MFLLSHAFDIHSNKSFSGLDIHNVMHVINFDLPSMMYGGIQEYTHRIGKSKLPFVLDSRLTLLQVVLVASETWVLQHRFIAPVMPILPRFL